MLTRLSDPRGLAAGRTAAGVMMLTRPGLLPATLGVDRASADRMGWVVQMLGAREVALGLGALVAPSRAWHAAGVFSDAVDALAVGTALRRGRVGTAAGGGVVAVAVAAVAIGVAALGRGPQVGE